MSDYFIVLQPEITILDPVKTYCGYLLLKITAVTEMVCWSCILSIFYL